MKRILTFGVHLSKGILKGKGQGGSCAFFSATFHFRKNPVEGPCADFPQADFPQVDVASPRTATGLRLFRKKLWRIISCLRAGAADAVDVFVRQ